MARFFIWLNLSRLCGFTKPGSLTFGHRTVLGSLYDLMPRHYTRTGFGDTWVIFTRELGPRVAGVPMAQ